MRYMKESTGQPRAIGITVRLAVVLAIPAWILVSAFGSERLKEVFGIGLGLVVAGVVVYFVLRLVVEFLGALWNWIITGGR